MKTNLLLRVYFPFDTSFLVAILLFITSLNEIKSNASIEKPILTNIIFFENKILLDIISSVKYDIINDLIKENYNKTMISKSNSIKNFTNYNRDLFSCTSFSVNSKSINNSYFIITQNNESYLMNIDYNKLNNITIQYHYLKIIQNQNEDKIIDIINGINYCIFITINKYKNIYYNLSLFKSILNIKKNKYGLILISKKNFIYSKGKSISCFISEKNIISCFYLNLENRYTIIIFDSNLIFKNILTLNYRNIYDNNFTFLKSVNLKKEIGIYIFFNDNLNNVPTILIKDLSDIYKINNVLPNYNEIKLYDYDFTNELALNDIIKISNNSFIYASTEKNKERIIISLFTLYNNDKKFFIKYFIINKQKFYQANSIFSSLKLQFYNDSILTLNSDYLLKDISQKDKSFSSLILFNYPNYTDIKIDVINYLLEKNEIIIDFNEIITIENNIFGHEIKSILFRKMNCSNFLLISNKTNDLLKGNELLLNKDEKIKVLLSKNEHKKSICTMEFNPKITKCSLEKIKKYSDKINNSYGDNFKDKYFSSLEYIGRTSYFNFIINKDINTNCNDTNCELCISDDKTFCILYKENNKINNNNIFSNYFRNKKFNIRRRIQGGMGGNRPGGGGSWGNWGGNHRPNWTNPRNNSYNDFQSTNQINDYEKTNLFTEKMNEKYIEFTENSEIQERTEQMNRETDAQTKELTEIKKKETDILNINTNKEISKTDKISKDESIETNKTGHLNANTDKITEKKYLKTNEIDFKTEESEQNSEMKIDCTNEEILNILCVQKIDNKKINDIYTYLQDDLVKNGYEKQKEIYTENTLFQITTLDEQKNNENKEISIIDLGDCELKLKIENQISEEEELIILKVDIKEGATTYVQYEVYDPISLVKLNLTICKEDSISIDLPVTLDEEINLLFNSLDKSGYSLYDLNDSFYNDICTKYTSVDNTDLTLSDRKIEIYDKTANLSFCQSGCTFQSYNATNKKAKCNCQVETQSIDKTLNNITFIRNAIMENFYITIKNSNIKVLKCYKLLFDIDNIIYNIGCIIMTIIYFLLIILLFIYFFISKKDINYFIQLILVKKKDELSKNSKDKKLNKKSISQRKSIKSKFNINNEKSKRKPNKNKTINPSKSNNKNKKKDKKKKDNNKIKKAKTKIEKSKKIKNCPMKKRATINKILRLSSSNDGNSHLFSSNLKLNESVKKNINISNSKINIYKPFDNLKEKKYKNLYPKKNYQFLNDQELNIMEYKLALVNDKRTFFQYYYSLLKRKHLILFSFIPNNDYNLRPIKISLFLISFSLFFSMNALFFTDNTMHKISQSKGAYNIIYQLPKIFYSTIITSFINTILKLLSLSENSILSIKQENNYQIICKKGNKIKNCLFIRIIVFYILSFIFMLFFWLFISCFCAVYINTQLILIYDTLFSFLASMIYPFGLNLIPGIFRIPSLRNPKRNKECLYKISTLLAFI